MAARRAKSHLVPKNDDGAAARAIVGDNIATSAFSFIPEFSFCGRLVKRHHGRQHRGSSLNRRREISTNFTRLYSCHDTISSVGTLAPLVEADIIVGALIAARPSAIAAELAIKIINADKAQRRRLSYRLCHGIGA